MLSDNIYFFAWSMCLNIQRSSRKPLGCSVGVTLDMREAGKGPTFSQKHVASKVRLRESRTHDDYLSRNLRPAEQWGLEHALLLLSVEYFPKLPGPCTAEGPSIY